MTMRMPFEVLVDYMNALTDEEEKMTLGELSKKFGEPVDRIMDAATVVRVLRGERTYISP